VVVWVPYGATCPSDRACRRAINMVPARLFVAPLPAALALRVLAAATSCNTYITSLFSAPHISQTAAATTSTSPGASHHAHHLFLFFALYDARFTGVYYTLALLRRHHIAALRCAHYAAAAHCCLALHAASFIFLICGCAHNALPLRSACRCLRTRVLLRRCVARRDAACQARKMKAKSDRRKRVNNAGEEIEGKSWRSDGRRGRRGGAA